MQLIHLIHASEFDAQMFIATVTARLHSAPPEVVVGLSTSLPKTAPVLTFQVALCHKYLSGFSAGSGAVNNRPKPRARARRGWSINALSTSPEKGNEDALSAMRSAVASYKEILPLVESRKLNSLPAFTMKYTLIVSYALLQSQAALDEKDQSWRDAQADGSLKRLICTTFPNSGEGSKYKNPLLIVCGLLPSG